MSLVEMATVSCVVFCFLSVFASTEASPFILSSTSGTFSYPSYKLRYPAGREVTWIINVEKGKYINLTLHVIDVEAYRGKCIDIIEIKDGNNSEAPLLGGYCNSNKPSYSILSSSNALRVWFQSANNSYGGLGFNVSYTTVLDNDTCGGLLKTFPGAIATPRYPLPYPNNHECSWTILAPKGVYIHVEFQGVYHLELLCSYGECECVDTLDIKDGGKPVPYASKIGYCLGKPRPFTSRTNEVFVKFVSDYSGRFEGFSATYTTSLTKECGADLWSEHGLITSPNYPYTYHSYRTCIWRITVPDDHYVIITFHEFDINKSYRPCFVDSVEIRDGYTEDSPLLAKLCNSNFVSTVNSTGNHVYIEFQSGYNLKATGFKATYAKYKRERVSDDVKKRKPRQNEEELLGSSQTKPSNKATKIMAAWWIMGLMGILRNAL